MGPGGLSAGTRREVVPDGGVPGRDAPDGALPVWVFLPGMMCDARLFGPQLDALAGRVDARVARFDAADTIEGFAREALALAHRAEGGDRDAPATLVGLSMGGIVAMRCLVLAPERIRAVVLLDTNPYAESPERRLSRAPQIRRALAGELDALLIDEMKPAYLAPENRHDETLLSLVLDMARGLGPEVFARQSAALASRPDHTDALRRWHGPAAIACGAHDALCPPARHEAMRALMPGASLDVVDGAGHLLTLERPDAVNRLLEDVLARTAPPADVTETRFA